MHIYIMSHYEIIKNYVSLCTYLNCLPSMTSLHDGLGGNEGLFTFIDQVTPRLHFQDVNLNLGVYRNVTCKCVYPCICESV